MQQAEYAAEQDATPAKTTLVQPTTEPIVAAEAALPALPCKHGAQVPARQMVNPLVEGSACGFGAKNAMGLKVHMRTCPKNKNKIPAAVRKLNPA